jgi:hypothetical protein
MKRFLQTALIASAMLAVSATVLARPLWPPLPYGYERVVYDGNGNAVGGFTSCGDDSTSWGTYTASSSSYADFPYNCP